ncbi:MAG: serine--tRNA ligase [Rhodospirillales bacterium]|nr:serine--tRNA ligase [Rhodospirillales bacterium]MCW9003408.1 serine--tRNA ligase [Rhodospirillales bacterium]MCW9040120.1 serine--tRNA ligase [Rhodospirillales bacterium]
MFDIKFIRENPDLFDKGLARRGVKPMAEGLLSLDRTWRDAQTRAQEIQTRRNALSKEIGIAKSKGEDASSLMEEVSLSKQAQADLEESARKASEELNAVLATIPNIPADDVPEGPDESANVEVRQWGGIRDFDFKPREHFEIGEGLGMMDFDRAAKLSGSRFVVLSGALARMERALGSFMLDMHTQEFGYREVNPPALVRDDALFGTGQLPKFSEDLFRTENGYWLIPTAEVPLTNLVAGEILDAETLPRRMTAMTWCFRSEAGASGKDTRGMIRQHQFSKVEMVSVVSPATANLELERMTTCAEAILKALYLPYRVVTLCTGDMGFSARKTYDIEVWLPGQESYREISSCSNCGDFQARRMNTRFRAKGEKQTSFVHTLNGSGLAIGRTLIAVLENYQQEDGTVVVPDVLKPYMNGLEVIEPNV